jgi:hypothetical protein
MLNKLADKTYTCLNYNYLKVEPHLMRFVGLKQFLDRITVYTHVSVDPGISLTKNIQKMLQISKQFLTSKYQSINLKMSIIQIRFNLDFMFYDPGVSLIIKILVKFCLNFSTYLWVIKLRLLVK